MASVSLVSSPPAPVLVKNTTDPELAGEEREDGELEDGEIDDEGIEIEEESKDAVERKEDDEKEKVKEKVKEKENTRRHSRKRYKKTREKKKSKRRRRDRPRHHSPSSSSSSDSYDSDYDRAERPRSRKSRGYSREPDGPSSLHSKAVHSSTKRPSPQRCSDYDKYSDDYSDDKFDYDEEEDEYDDDMSEYQSKDREKVHHTKDQGRGSMRGMKQHPYGQRGRGRGVGRGRGYSMLKNKKLKGKPWGGRGRGRGEQGMEDMAAEGRSSIGFQKKRPIMSKEFINQHTVEHNGRYICKYFLEGRCIKGEQCKFEHEHVIPDKKKELCKFYLQGYCSKGDHCIYMHNEYPCKFFHTGAKCYQGDNCKFSHDVLNDVTKELLEKIINTEEENAREDELELEDLRKQGISPLPKPPPGVGLLPTPGQSSPTEGAAGKKIPSLFEIKVKPTVDLVQKIAQSGSSYSNDQEDGTNEFSGESEETPSAPASVHPSESPAVLGQPAGPPVPQTPPSQLQPHGFPTHPASAPGHPPSFDRPNTNMQMNTQRPQFPTDLQMLQNMLPFQVLGQTPGEFGGSFPQNQPSAQQVEPGQAFVQNLQQLMGADSQLQSLPPAVQKAILIHLTQQHQQQQQQQSQGSEPHGAEGQDNTGESRDITTNWYSSDDEDGGSCVSSILKTLKKQNKLPLLQPKLIQAAPGAAALSDPRIMKERAQPSDPRVKTDSRQRLLEFNQESEEALDPRLARDPRKIRVADSASYHQQSQSAPQKPSVGEDEEEGERALKDRAVLIPLDASPGVVLRDPRCQLKQFSHIRVDILLQRPAFAHSVVWAPEDLIPSLIPKQEHSINLPLPPLIADAQLNRTSQQDQPKVSSPPPSDPRLAAARLKERLSRLTAESLESRPSMERPVDPRQQKCLDPRLKRRGSLDSKLLGQKEPTIRRGPVDPRLQKLNSPVQASQIKPEPEKLPPYAPRLASSDGGLDSPITLLGGISLYDPRSQSEQERRERKEAPLKPGILKQPSKADTTASLSPVQLSGSPDGLKGTDATSCQSSPPTSPTGPPASPVKPPAVHNLPIPALAGLIRPQYTDPRQARAGGHGTAGAQDEAEVSREVEEVVEENKEDKSTEEEPKEKDPEEEEDRTLKDVFKTFDPTASPFCQ